jgi:hypothetical protein
VIGPLTRGHVSRVSGRFVLALVLVSSSPFGFFARNSPPNQPSVDAALAFLKTLRAEQRARANVALTAETRSTWSNLPASGNEAAKRNGVRLADMNEKQTAAAMALVASALSREGYAKVTAILDAEEETQRRAVAAGFSGVATRPGPWRKDYYLAILGRPAAGSTWMLQVGGHHLAINVTFIGDRAFYTPAHTGADPAYYSKDGIVHRALGGEHDKAHVLVNALSDEQRAQAMLPSPVKDLLLGAGQDGKSFPPEGVRASTFSADQKSMLLDLVHEWIGMARDDEATRRMAEIAADLDATRFAWSGPTMNNTAAYFRIQGPSVFIEYAPQDSAEHVHTIYRDPSNDYGAKIHGR